MRYLMNRILRFFGVINPLEKPQLTNNFRYIVFNPQWPDPPRLSFASLEDAKRLAERLSKKQPTHEFYVMKSVLRVTVAVLPQIEELPGSEDAA
jgi:hypothetical protein